MDFRKGEIIAIDKPYRMSSFGALAHVRYLLSKKLGFKVKIGHAGTLDPLATGVLVLCTGKCTKQIEQLQTHTKEYTATLQLGATTASYDKEHSVNHTYPTKHITRQLVEETLKQFVGEIQQVPPTYSAVKVNGDRSYALRRAGEEVQLKPKTVRVDEIELTDYNDEEKTASIRVVCGKGTYIRSQQFPAYSLQTIHRPQHQQPPAYSPLQQVPDLLLPAKKPSARQKTPLLRLSPTAKS